MDFYNRQVEIAQLENAWAGIEGRPGFVVVYGRRRCGKSTLLRRLARPGDVYFLATEGEATLQRRLLARELAKRFPAFDAVEYADYDQLLTVLLARVTEPFTLVLDEFPYLVRGDASLPSILQRYLDLREPGQFSLALCGSSQQMMHDAVLSGTAPLYGRADEILRVGPLEAGWLAEALPGVAADDLVQEYAVWGGVPRYWESRRRYGGLEEAVRHLLLRPSGLYSDEPQRLLLDDLRDLAQPITLLSAIAQGVHRPSELAGRLGRRASELVRPLARLTALGYIRREVPFGTSAKRSRSVHYVLDDPFLRFYYRFVVPGASAIGAGADGAVWREIVAALPGFVAQVWEDLTRRAVLRGLAGEDVTRAGRWWGKGSGGAPMEIDVVASPADAARLVVVECKWSELGGAGGLRDRLVEKAQRLPDYRGQPVDAFIACRAYSGKGERPAWVWTPAEVLERLVG